MSTDIDIYWSAKYDVNRAKWRLYVSEAADEKGALIKETDANATWWVFTPAKEKTYWVRVMSVSRAGVEEDWTTSTGWSKITVTRQENVPATLSSAGAAQVSAPQGISVIVDPVPQNDPPQDIEVIRGDDEWTGQSVGKVAIPGAGVTGEGGERTASPIVLPMPPGRGSGGGTETIVLRGVTRDGNAPGPSTSVTVPFVSLPNHTSTVIASLVTATTTNIPSPSTTVAWEIDGTNGFQLKAIPTWVAATSANGWGTYSTGLLGDALLGSRFLRTATVTCGEKDLGAEVDFVLECYDEGRRETAAVTLTWGNCRYHYRPQEMEGISDTALSPAWMGRLLTYGGKCNRPVLQTSWEYRAGTSTPLGGSFSYYVAGTRLRARYVQARFTVTEPMGLHRIIAPRVYIRAWRPWSGDAAGARTALGLTTVATSPPAASQADSTAADVPSLVSDFNSLLGKLRTAGLMAP